MKTWIRLTLLTFCLVLLAAIPVTAFNLPAASGSTTDTLIFSQVRLSGASTPQAVTITNTSGSPLVVNSITLIGTDATEYQFQAAPVVPVPIPAGNTVTVANVQFNSTSSGVKVAQVQIQTAAPDNGTYFVELRGLATYGIGGSAEPSMAWIMETFNLTTDVGDDNPADIWIDSVDGGAPLVGPDEVAVEVFEAANPANPVTLQVLASYGGNVNPVSRVGWYDAQNVAGTNQLFTIPQADAQTLNPTTNGVTSFNPGAATFGFYSQWPAFANRMVYTQNGYNTVWAGAQNNKMRVFLHRDSSGTVVPNSYIITTEEFTSPPHQHDYNDVVFIVSNVQPGTITNGGTIRFENRDWQTLNGINVPGMEYLNTWLTFSQIVTIPGGGGHGEGWAAARVHEQVALRIHNDNPVETLDITSLTISNNALFELPNGETTLTIPAGGFYDLTVGFRQSCGGNGNRQETLTITSTDAVSPTSTITLAGLCSNRPEGSFESNVTRIGMAFGLTTDFGIVPDGYSPVGGQWIQLGEEIFTWDWLRVDSSEPIYFRQLAAYHFCCGPETNSRLNFYGTIESMRHDNNDGQSLLPLTPGVPAPTAGVPTPPNVAAPAELTANRDGGFFFEIDGNRTCTSPCANNHAVRVWPWRDPSGNVVPDAYIVGMDYTGGGTSTNFDYNDNMYIITNVRPRTPLVNITTDMNGPTISSIGNNLTYTVVVRNDSIFTARDVSEAITIPASFNLNSITTTQGSCNSGVTPIDCTIGDMNGETQAIITLNVTPMSLGTFNPSATASVNSPETQTDDNTDSVEVTINQPGPRIRMVKTPDNQTIDSGATASFTLTLTNTGTEDLDTITVSDPRCTTVPAYVSGDAGSDSIMTPGEVWVYTCDTTNVTTGFTNVGSVTANHSGGQVNDSDSATVSMTPILSNCPSLYRINSGGPQLPAADGSSPDWTSDISPASPYVNGGNNTSTNTEPITFDATIPASVPPALFSTERWDPANAPEMEWIFPVVQTGVYEVRLYFAETLRTWTGDWFIGGRVFDVSIEGNLVLDSYDMYADTGDVGAATNQWFLTTVTDGAINVLFEHVVENPTIKAIEIVPTFCSNAPPQAINDTATTPESTAVTIDILNNDSDPDGDPLVASSIVIQNAPTNGTITDVNTTTGVVTYVPNALYSGTDIFTYTVNDSEGDTSNIATVTVTVTPVNDPPTTQDDSAITVLNTAVVIPVLNNDFDFDGGLNPASVSEFAAPASGTLLINPVNGNIEYTPGGGFVGVDSFTYEVCDNDPTPLCTTALVTVTVNAVNTAPTANPDAETINENTTISIDVTGNDTDPESDPLTLDSITIPPPNGIALIISGEISYTPNPNFVGVDTLEYQICDPFNLCDTAIVTVNIANVNAAPAANNDNGSMPQDTSLLLDVLANDTDPDSDPLTIDAITVNAANGTANIQAGQINYVPAAGYVGTDYFEYRACDTGAPALCDTARVTVVMTLVNQPPIAYDDTTSTERDVSVALDVVANDNDPELSFDLSSLRIISPTTDGTIDSVVGAVVTYTPGAGFIGTDSFDYEICDVFGLCDTATASILVQTPAGSCDAIYRYNNGGTQVLAADGTTPAWSEDQSENTANPPAQNGSASPYLVVNHISNDRTAGTNSAITRDPYLPPQAPDVLFQRYRWDPNADGDGAMAWEFPVTNGSYVVRLYFLEAFHTAADARLFDIALEENTRITNFDTFDRYGALVGGDESFLVTVSDGVLNIDLIRQVDTSAINGIEIFRSACDDVRPRAIDDTANTGEATSVIIDVPANDTDDDGNIVRSTVSITTDADDGTTAIAANGTITYTPNAGFFGIDTIEYVISDNDGISSRPGTVEITVAPNQPPVAGDDSILTRQDVAATINVLANDTDADDTLDTASVAIVTGAANGTATVETNGTVTYTPNAGYAGTDTFTYTVNDSRGATSNVATVRVNVIDPTNNPPTGGADAASIDGTTPVTINVLVNDSDPENAPLSVVGVSLAVPDGTTAFTATTVIFTPPAIPTGSYTFTYDLTDGTYVIPVDVTINITAGNNPPDAVDDTLNALAAGNSTLRPLTNDSDPDGDSISLTQIITPPTNGTATIQNNREIDYSTTLAVGTDTIVYEICDPAGLCDTATITLNIAPNDPPVTVDDVTTAPPNIQRAINVMSNDSDPDGDLLLLQSVTQGDQGGIVFISGTQVAYQPAQGFVGVETFTYTITDGFHTTTGTVTVTVQRPVDPPPTDEDNGTQVAAASDEQDDDLNPEIEVFDPALSKLGLLLPGQLGIEGERLEWQITARNIGNATGTNVIVTDTLRSELQIDDARTSKGTINISGQTVTFNIGTLAPGEVVQMTIVTTVLQGGQRIDNTACLSATEGSECVTGLTVRALPATGESQHWKLYLFLLICITGSISTGYVTFSSRNNSVQCS